MAIVSGLGNSRAAKEPKLQPEEAIVRHLASIGTPEARAAVKSCVAQGNAAFRFVQGGSGGAAGPAFLVSEGHKVRLLLQFPQPDYTGEEFAFDGKKITAGFMRPGIRSPLEGFIQQNDETLIEGLLGGTLSTAWPLLNFQSGRAGLEYKGVRKIRGRELLRFHYRSSKGSENLEVDLYFEPESFRHVLTVYEQTVAPSMATSDLQSARLQVQRQTLEEEFSDFQVVDGLNLPTRWKMTLSQDTARGSAIMEFEMTFGRIRHNLQIEPATFQIQ